MTAGNKPTETTSAAPNDEDVVGDRTALLSIGMLAVLIACVVFGILRFIVQLSTGRATPWWGNVTAAIAIGLLYFWYRRSPSTRSAVSVHGTALIATVALLIPAAYGMSSSKWWISLVGFSVLLMGRRLEGIVWTIITIILVPTTALVENYVVVENAIGEPIAERALSGFGYVALLLGVTWAFRKVAQQRARDLADAAASLKRANLVKGRFLAHMSHEVRTPLHGVIAMTDMARDGAASQVVRHQIESAHESAKALLGLLNNILDVTRGEADALELDHSSFRLHSALTDVLRPIAAQAQAKGLSVDASAAPGVDEYRLGDRVRVSQIALNLLGNAVKFTKQGSVQLRLAADSNDDEVVVISVTDTGPGISPSAIDKIFEPFTQAEIADADKFNGAGLGLAIVRDLAKRMGGQVTVASELGKGSTFTARLRLPSSDPAKKTPGPEDLLPTISDQRPRNSSRPTRVLKILACEDNVVNQKAMMAMLSHLGYEAKLAQDGVIALKMLDTEPFDVLLTDIEMPNMDGITLTQKIRDQERTLGKPPIPIVGATAHVGEGERNRLIEIGMTDYIGKPFTLNDLSLVLQKLSGR